MSLYIIVWFTQQFLNSEEDWKIIMSKKRNLSLSLNSEEDWKGNKGLECVYKRIITFLNSEEDWKY